MSRRCRTGGSHEIATLCRSRDRRARRRRSSGGRVVVDSGGRREPRRHRDIHLSRDVIGARRHALLTRRRSLLDRGRRGRGRRGRGRRGRSHRDRGRRRSVTNPFRDSRVTAGRVRPRTRVEPAVRRCYELRMRRAIAMTADVGNRRDSKRCENRCDDDHSTTDARHGPQNPLGGRGRVDRDWRNRSAQ